MSLKEKGRGRQRQRYTGKKAIGRQAEAGIMLPLAKGHLERLGEASKDFPRSFQRECGQYLDFGLLTSRTVREQVFVVLNPKTS